MWKNNLSHAQALDLIREKRGCIDPNIGFVGQLMDLHKKFQSTRGLTPRSTNILNRPHDSRVRHPYIRDYIKNMHDTIDLSQNQFKPRLFSYSRIKEKLSVRNFNNSNTKNAQQQLENEGITEEVLQDLLDTQAVAALAQLQSCFIVYVSKASPSSEHSRNEAHVVKRASIYMLKLAQLLAKYEKGPQVGYIYSDRRTLSRDSQLLKIPNILSMKLTMPDDSPSAYRKASFALCTDDSNHQYNT